MLFKVIFVRMCLKSVTFSSTVNLDKEVLVLEGSVGT